MIPHFILDTCAHGGTNTFGEQVYWFSTKDQDGWVVYWPTSNDTLHTYRDPAEWAVVQEDGANY